MCQKEMCENPNCDSTRFYKAKGMESVEYRAMTTAPRLAYSTLA